MRRRTVVLIVIVFGLFGWWALAGAQQVRTDAQKPERTPLERFMQRKLDLSQGILAGLSREDLASVDADAQHLSLLCLDEDWNLVKTPDYVERSADFRRTANEIAKAARDQELSAAQLAYVQLVGQCFSCHAAVRRARSVK